MIKNSKQFSVARETLKQLQNERNEIIVQKGKISEIKYQIAIDSYDSLIEGLIEDIETYEKLINENYHCFKNKSMEKLGELLISIRLAQGLTQRDLAGVLGIQEQQIQRYEQTDYESASLARLLEVADALNVNLIYKDIENLGKHPTFILPSNMEEDAVSKAEIALKSQCSLVFA